MEDVSTYRNSATSVMPGTNPGGTYIGQETINGNTYRYFKDNTGQVSYTSSGTDKVQMELLQSRERRGRIRKL